MMRLQHPHPLNPLPCGHDSFVAATGVHATLIVLTCTAHVHNPLRPVVAPPRPQVRDWIVPVNRKHDLAALSAALRDLFPKRPARAAPGASASAAAGDDDTDADGSPEAVTSSSGAGSATAAAEARNSGVPGSSAFGGADGASAPAPAPALAPVARGRRHLLIQYTMLAGVNDSLEDAVRLAELTKDIECKINLIEFNPHEGTRFRPSPREQVRMDERDACRRLLCCLPPWCLLHLLCPRHSYTA